MQKAHENFATSLFLYFRGDAKLDLRTLAARIRELHYWYRSIGPVALDPVDTSLDLLLDWSKGDLVISIPELEVLATNVHTQLMKKRA